MKTDTETGVRSPSAQEHRGPLATAGRKEEGPEQSPSEVRGQGLQACVPPVWHDDSLPPRVVESGGRAFGK